MRKRVLFALLAAVCAAFSLVGCSKKTDTADVGVFLALTGPQADFGITTRDGILLAAEEINAAGGVNGKKLNMIVEDDRGNPPEARTVVTKLIDQSGVIAILGDVASSNSIAAAPVCQARQVPMITPSSTNPNVTQLGDYVFRVCFIDPFQGYVMAKFATDNLKAKTAAVLWDNSSDYSSGLAKVFKEEFPRMGGRIVADVTFKAQDIDFSAQLTKIRAASPDVIFVPAYYTEVTLIAQKARELGIKVPLLGGDGWTSPTLIQRAAGALEGCYHSDHYSVESTDPEVQGFVKKFEKKYGHKPNSLAALGYDATKILAEAMKRAGGFDKAKIRNEISRTKDYQGVTGNITINAERNAVKPAVVLRIKGNKISYLTTIDPPK